MNRKNRDIINFLIAIFIFYAFLHFLKITCPIKALTGISCPGCGMTRAWLCVLKLDFKEAFLYHPLFMLPPIWVITYIYCHKRQEYKALNRLTAIYVILFFICYFIRMFNPHDHIVIFRPDEGLIYRIILKLIELVKG